MIEKIISWSMHNRFFVWLGIILITMGGVYSVATTPVDAIPDLSENQVIIYTEWMGRNLKIMEDQITYPLVSNLQGIPDLNSIQAASMFGMSFIFVILQDDVEGALVFKNSSLEENSKINLVRFNINNDGSKHKAGYNGTVTIHRNKKQALVIPKSALLIGSMTMVWIESSDDMFESRIVKTGIENKKFAEVLSGLQEGDLIVTSGAYLLNSEFILKKGAVKAHNH